jgi:hypothetical protein
MSRTISFLVGLSLAGLASMAALGDPGGWVKGGWTNDPTVLCVNGHPAPRRPNVTYGDLPTKTCCERDHIVPLGLGSPDILDNLQYQPWPEARVKDQIERQAEETYCRNPSPQLLDQLRGQFKRQYP